MVGPASSTANALPRYSGTTGKLLKNSATTLSDAGVLRINNAYSLPAADGTAGQQLSTNGAGSVSWSSGGTGDVTGPAISTNNAVVRFDSFTGKVIQNSGIELTDLNQLRPVSDIGGELGGTSNRWLNIHTAAVDCDGDVVTNGLVMQNSDVTVYSLPTVDGTVGQQMTTDGAGAVSWVSPLVGPGSSTDNTLARFNGTDGLKIQGSSATLSDSGVLGVSGLTVNSAYTFPTTAGEFGQVLINEGGGNISWHTLPDPQNGTSPAVELLFEDSLENRGYNNDTWAAEAAPAVYDAAVARYGTHSAKFRNDWYAASNGVDSITHDNDVSICLWVRMTVQANQGIFGIRSTDSSLVCELNNTTATSIEFKTPDLTLSTGNVLSNDVWYHIVASYAPGGDARLYLDGVLADSASAAGIELKVSFQKYVGRSFTYGSSSSCNVDNFRMFASQLTLDQVNLDKNNESVAPLGDVVGPSLSTNDSICRFDGTTGKLITVSAAVIDDAGILSANGLVAASASGLQTDIISEKTAAAGVTIDGVLVKDGAVTGDLNGTATAATTAILATTASSLATGALTDAMVSGSANIASTKLATITTAGKVANSATTADSANTSGAIVARNASGDINISDLGCVDIAASGNIQADGNLTLGDGSAGRAIDINGPVGGSNTITFQSGGLNRWRMDVSAEETGSDFGAQFRLRAFDDAGDEKGVALYIARTNLEFVSGGNFRRLGSATTAECGTATFPWAATYSVNIIGGDVIRSGVNNVCTLGNSSFRFNEVFATNGAINTSDSSLKQDVTDLGSTLADPVTFLMSLRPVMYRWKATTEVGPPDENGDPTYVEIPAGTRFHLGLIAQEVEQALIAAGVDPSSFGAWTKDPTTGLQGIRYTELVPLLIHANKMMISSIQSLTARVTALEALSARLDVLEGRATPAGALRPISEPIRRETPLSEYEVVEDERQDL